jgi:hypothetical protein
VCSFRGGSLTDSDLCRLLASVLSWKERLLFVVDLPAPYLDEKLSDWRGLRANMMLRRRSELPMIQDPDGERFMQARRSNFPGRRRQMIVRILGCCLGHKNRIEYKLFTLQG